MNDQMGDRFKEYENTFRYKLPRKSNVIIRIDGKAFHTYTKGCKQPYDDDLIDDMNSTAVELCKQIQGAKIAFVQSDEISIFITDYDNLETNAWFDNNIQKMVSVSASIATAEFNKLRNKRYYLSLEMPMLQYSGNYTLAHFDSRAFIVPNIFEVANYFLWRSNDAAKNSVQSFARSLYSHKELQDKNIPQLHDLIYAKGQNWNDLNSKYKRGRFVNKIEKAVEVHDDNDPGEAKMIIRSEWKIFDLADYTYAYWKDIVDESLKQIKI